MSSFFSSEAERLRAREAYVTIQHAGCQNEATTIEAAGTVMDCEYCKDDGAVFDNYYPPQPAAPVGMHPCRVCGVPVWEEYEICDAECAAKMTPTMECCCNMDAPMPDRECPIHGDPTFTAPAPSFEAALDAYAIDWNAWRLLKMRDSIPDSEEEPPSLTKSRARVLSLAAPRLSREEAEKMVTNLVTYARLNDLPTTNGAYAKQQQQALAALLAALTGEGM